MDPASLIARAWSAGYRVELTLDGPSLARVRDDAECPPDLLADLRANRLGLVRHIQAAPVIARALERRRAIWGYNSARGRVAMLPPKKGIPDDWDRIAAEGDPEWTTLDRVPTPTEAHEQRDAAA